MVCLIVLMVYWVMTMENYDVILRPKESLMYIGVHEIPLMSEFDSCQEYCIIGSRIERNSVLSGSVRKDKRRRGKGRNDPSPAASVAESSDGETEGSRMLPPPVARSADSEEMVNRDFDSSFEEESFLETLGEYANILQLSEGQAKKGKVDSSSTDSLIAKVSFVPTGTKGVRFDTRVRTIRENRINPSLSTDILIKLPDKLYGDVILVPAEFEDNVLEVVNLGPEDMENRIVEITVKNRTNHELAD